MPSHRFSKIFTLFFAVLLQTSCGEADEKKEVISGNISADAIQTTQAQSEKGVYQIKVDWAPGELKAGNEHNHTAHITITHLDGSSPETAELSAFTLTMPAHGHGTNEADQKIMPQMAEANYFMVNGIHFSMAGSEGMWQAEIIAKIDGQEDSATIGVPRVM